MFYLPQGVCLDNLAFLSCALTVLQLFLIFGHAILPSDFVLTESSELSDLAMEAAKTDGRLARHPLKESRREFQAHQMLLSHITHLMQKYDVAIKVDYLAMESACLTLQMYEGRNKLRSLEIT